MLALPCWHYTHCVPQHLMGFLSPAARMVYPWGKNQDVPSFVLVCMRLSAAAGCWSLPHLWSHSDADAWLVQRPQVCSSPGQQRLAPVETEAQPVSRNSHWSLRRWILQCLSRSACVGLRIGHRLIGRWGVILRLAGRGEVMAQHSTAQQLHNSRYISADMHLVRLSSMLLYVVCCILQNCELAQRTLRTPVVGCCAHAAGGRGGGGGGAQSGGQGG